MSATYSASTIAQWFVNRAAMDVSDGGEYLTHLKLQKLLYYAQGCYLALKNQPLFDDEIYCWTHGPVVATVYQEYKHFKDNVLDKVYPVKIDRATEDILDEVYNVFGQYSALRLRSMTHAETSWKTTKQNEVIPLNIIKDYFEKNYIAK